MEKDTIRLDTLLDFSNVPIHVLTRQWMNEQIKCMSSMPEDSVDYWDKEDDYNEDLDYAPDKYNGQKTPDLSHLKVSSQGKILLESLPNI